MGKVDFSWLKDDVFLLSPDLVPPPICSLSYLPLVMTSAKLIGECDFRSSQGPGIVIRFLLPASGSQYQCFLPSILPKQSGAGHI